MTDETSATGTDSQNLDATEQRTAVRERYARIATEESSCCGDTESKGEVPSEQASELGYSSDDLDTTAQGANLSLGCGNPTAIASLTEGDTVLDLGSGAGFDCFLTAREAGTAGRVIGVDMTPEMVKKPHQNREMNDTTNIGFRLDDIKHLSVADESVDVIVSNCVVDRSPDKSRAFREAYRVLRRGGRLPISDIVLTTGLPTGLRVDPASVAARVGGESSISALEAMLTDAGFTDVSIEPKADSEDLIRDWDDERDLSDYIAAAAIEGEKPVTESQL